MSIRKADDAQYHRRINALNAISNDRRSRDLSPSSDSIGFVRHTARPVLELKVHYQASRYHVVGGREQVCSPLARKGPFCFCDAARALPPLPPPSPLFFSPLRGL